MVRIFGVPVTACSYRLASFNRASIYLIWMRMYKVSCVGCKWPVCVSFWLLLLMSWRLVMSAWHWQIIICLKFLKQYYWIRAAKTLVYLEQQPNRLVNCPCNSSQDIAHFSEMVSLGTHEYSTRSLGVKEKIRLYCTPLMPVPHSYNTAEETRVKSFLRPHLGEKLLKVVVAGVIVAVGLQLLVLHLCRFL